MKRKATFIILIVALLAGGAIYLYNKLNTQVVYAVTKDGWVEVYRSVSPDKAREKFNYLECQQFHKPEGVFFYIYVDEDLGNSIIP